MELSSGPARDIALVTPLAASRQPEPARRESKECRLCFESIGEDFIAPCRCSGTSRWVHRQCLNQWRSSGTNRRAFDRCCECGYAYSLILERQETDVYTIRRRQTVVVMEMLRDCLLTFALIQMWLILLALVIHSCDPRESIAKEMELSWDKFPPPGLSWFERMRYNKASYYLAAVILTVLLIGFFSFVDMCTGGSTWLDDFAFARDSRLFAASLLDDNSVGQIVTELWKCIWDPSVSSSAGGIVEELLVRLALLLLLALLATMILGLVMVLCFIVTAGQRAVMKVLEVPHLRVLACDYMVEDLSSCNPPINFPAQPEIQDGTLFGPVTDPTVQRSLLRDMQALYRASL